jgi:hypothetical protein
MDNYDYKQLKAYFISALADVVITQPIDYLKTFKQKRNTFAFTNNESFNLSQHYMNLSKGITSRLVGTIPMRIFFWNSINYCNSKKLNSIQTGIITSFFETIIDYPVEQAKTQKMLYNKPYIQSFNNINIKYAFSTQYIRNALFAIIISSTFFSESDKSKNYSIIQTIFGTSIATIISHPFDSLKTWYQCGNHNYPKHWKTYNYMQGCGYRTLSAVVGVNTGWYVYKYLSK